MANKIGQLLRYIVYQIIYQGHRFQIYLRYILFKVLFRLPLFLIVVTWSFLFCLISIGTGEMKVRSTYVDENALKQRYHSIYNSNNVYIICLYQILNSSMLKHYHFKMSG